MRGRESEGQRVRTISWIGPPRAFASAISAAASIGAFIALICSKRLLIFAALVPAVLPSRRRVVRASSSASSFSRRRVTFSAVTVSPSASAIINASFASARAVAMFTVFSFRERDSRLCTIVSISSCKEEEEKSKCQ